MFGAIREAAAGRGTAPADFTQALHVQEIVEAADVSSTEARWVDIAALD